MKNIIRSVSGFFSRLRKGVKSFFTRGRGGKTYRKSAGFARRKPIWSLVLALLLLLLVIGLGSFLSTLGQDTEEVQEEAQEVEVYAVGESPTVTLQAEIQDTGVIQITALSGGVVSSIPAREGDTLSKGETVVNLSTNYSGASLPGLQTQLARSQYNNVVETYDTQKDIISKQRQIAEKTDENTDELRKINESSLGDTRSLLDQNENLMDSLNTQLEQLEQSGADPAAIFATQQAQAQLQGGINQLRSTVRSLEYETNSDNPPQELSNLQKDMTLRQLDIQEKALDLARETSRLQYQIAAVSESLLHPTSPFEAVVEKVHVEVGDSVAPGTVLVTISCTDIVASAVVRTPARFALSISQIEPSKLTLDGEVFDVHPTYISSVATDGRLYSVLYDIPEEAQKAARGSSFAPIDVPIAIGAGNEKPVPFLPIDAVYQGQDGAYVNVINGDVAQTKEVELGAVYGEYVEVTSGLVAGDKVILNRNVISGDRVFTQ